MVFLNGYKTETERESEREEIEKVCVIESEKVCVRERLRKCV